MKSLAAQVTGASDGSLVPLLLNGVVLLVLVLLSALFSGSETALFSLSRAQLGHDAASPNRLRRLAVRLMQHPKRTLMTILLGNTSVNVLLFATSYVFFLELTGSLGAWVAPLSGVFSVLVVVTFGEVVPKVLAVRLADRLAPYAAFLVQVTGTVLGPVGRMIDLALVEPLTRVLFGQHHPGPASEHDVTTAELKALLEMSRRRGLIDPTEDSFVREVLDLNSLRVRDVMVPRVEIRAYDVDGPPGGLRELIRATRFKKIPVYDKSMDNVVGLVYAKVLFMQPEQPLRKLVQSVRFVPEIITCERLLRHFRETGTQLAIAVDEYGGVAGLVTLEDLLEEIVGEIESSAEEETEPDIRQLGDDEFEISGRLSAHYWAEAFGVPRLTERVATVGGLVTARLGRPARVRDRIRLGNIELEVLGVQRRRIERLRLTVRSDHPGVPAA